MSSSEDSVSLLAAQSEAVGRLAQDRGAFAAVFAAFESKDPDAFRWVLERLELLPHCELICEWVLIKTCVLRCIQVCGPIPEEELPDLNQFAHAVVRLASNDLLMRRVVDAVSCGDAESYRAAIAELELERFCHLICRWVCSIIYRRVCEIVCAPIFVPLPDAVSEIHASAKVIGHLVARDKDFEAIDAAAARFDCELLRSAVVHAGFVDDCEIICRLICTWRCARVCRVLCERASPILTGALAIEEARNFALAARQLAAQPRALGDLVAAVRNQDVRAYNQVVGRFGLGPFCEQICTWVCSRICTEFCFCVCVPPAPRPWFMTVGYFDITADIDAAGKTNKGLPSPQLDFHGGPNFAFFGCLELGGFCPSTSPGFPGVAMKYRFLWDNGSGPTPVTGSFVCDVEAGTRQILWPVNAGGIASAATTPVFQAVWISDVPEPDPIPPAPGALWVPPSGHYIKPDPQGWVTVDPNALGGGFQTLMGFNSLAAVPGGPAAPGVPAGTAVPAAAQRMGTDLSITFEATRVTTMPPGVTPDYTNALSKIHINNWSEVNEPNFLEFVMGPAGCCTPINATLSVQFTVDHEEMASGAWSLSITSCSPSAPGDITPHATSLASGISAVQTSINIASSDGVPAAPFNVALNSTGEIMRVTAVVANTWTVLRGQQGTAAAAAVAGTVVSTVLPGTGSAALTARGGSGTIVENTSAWDSCSYTVWLVTRPGLTTGARDRDALSTPLTFCICGH